MKPTMIRTETTKGIRCVQPGETVTIEIGGVEHKIRRNARHKALVDFVEWTSGRSGFHRNCIHPDAQVTVTDTREMTTKDLQVGDCFRVDWQRDELAFRVWLGDWRVISVCQDAPPTVEQVREAAWLEVTLVNVEFEAVPLDTERTIPVKDLRTGQEFTLHGKTGKATGFHDKGFSGVRWEWPHDNGGVIPEDTPVTVTDAATYDSADDVSVGDVVLNKYTGEPGIVLSQSESDRDCFTVMYYNNPGISVMDGHRHTDFKPARLTSVAWTPREEVTR